MIPVIIIWTTSDCFEAELGRRESPLEQEIAVGRLSGSRLHASRQVRQQMVIFSGHYEAELKRKEKLPGQEVGAKKAIR